MRLGRTSRLIACFVISCLSLIIVYAEEKPAASFISYFVPNSERSWYLSPLLSIDPGAGLIYHDRNFFQQNYQAEIYTFLAAGGYQKHYLNLHHQSLRYPTDMDINLAYDARYKYYYGLGPDTVAAIDDADNNDEGIYLFLQKLARSFLSRPKSAGAGSIIRKNSISMFFPVLITPSNSTRTMANPLITSAGNMPLHTSHFKIIFSLSILPKVI